ncbi:MAG: FAA hydrolase family protein, partial [Candidatus Neomarinimicrobiota bacterium]
GFDVHHELEIVALVGRRGSPATVDEASRWVAGLALGIDFTLRDLQADCKAKGLPWFRAKSFRQSAFASPFLSPESPVWSEPFWLEKNGERVQEGERRQMLFSIPALIHEIGIIHALYPGDLIYTGTPQGVGSVNAGDRLRLGIGDRLLSTVSIDIAPVK